MPDKQEVRETVEDLREIVKRDLPVDDKGVLKGVIESLEEWLEIPYEEDSSPHQQKKKYTAVYKRKLGRGD